MSMRQVLPRQLQRRHGSDTLASSGRDRAPRRVAAWLRRLILLAAFVALVGYFLSGPPTPQKPDYHLFADRRTILAVQNGLNVLSNIPFLLIGIAGLWTVLASTKRQALAGAGLAWPYVALFVGTALTAFGSAYYHLDPNNQSLVWDRLPMAIGLMGLLSAVIGERVGRRHAQVLLAPLLLAGLASVVYWHATEQLARGDLRPYLLVQYGSLVFIALLMLLYSARWTHSGYLWAGFAAYAIAKLLEAADTMVFAIGQVVSGHTLKHLAAAAGLAFIVQMLRVRVRIDSANTPSEEVRRRPPPAGSRRPTDPR